MGQARSSSTSFTWPFGLLPASPLNRSTESLVSGQLLIEAQNNLGSVGVNDGGFSRSGNLPFAVHANVADIAILLERHLDTFVVGLVRP